MSERKLGNAAIYDQVDKVPDKFIKHILSLGFRENDAGVLYREKESWMGISKAKGKDYILVLVTIAYNFIGELPC